MPRPGYGKALAQLDDYLYGIIRQRRAQLRNADQRPPRGEDAGPTDLLTALVRAPGMDDELIRDQLLTMLIAGHDTSTALLTWSQETATRLTTRTC